MKRDLIFTYEYPHPPEKVWAALTDPRAMEVWLMDTDFQPQVGSAFKFYTEQERGFDGIIRCQVTACEPLVKLAYTWDAPPNVLDVSWNLEPTATGTRLRLEQRGFKGIIPIVISFILQRHWPRHLNILLRKTLDVAPHYDKLPPVWPNKPPASRPAA